MKLRTLSIFLVLMAIIYITPACISDAEYYLGGTVHDAAKNPIPGARVQVNFYCASGSEPTEAKLEEDIDHDVTTDSSGSYFINHNNTEVIIPPGNSCFEDKVYIIVTKSGYQKKTLKVDFNGAYSARANIQLDP